MLTNLWSWPSAPTSNADRTTDSAKNNNNNPRIPRTPTGSSVGLFGEDLLAADENEDDLADALLTQFPAYGSRQSPSNPPTGRIPTAEEWLRMGVGLGSTPEDEHDDDEKKDPYEMLSGSQRRSNTHLYTFGGAASVASATAAATSTPPRRTGTTATSAAATSTTAAATTASATVVLKDRGDLSWDIEEQNLWRCKNLDGSSPPNSPTVHGYHGDISRTSPTRRRDQPAPRRLSKKTGTSSTTSTSAAPTSPPVALLRSLSNRGLGSSIHHHDRQHWMPDQLCRQCYSCETQFTVFRRRHHCRLCGQVFCNACSANFVPSSSGSTIRVCQYCFDQVQEQGGKVDIALTDPSHEADADYPLNVEQQGQDEPSSPVGLMLSGGHAAAAAVEALHSSQSTAGSPQGALHQDETALQTPTKEPTVSKTHDTLEGTEVIAILEPQTPPTHHLKQSLPVNNHDAVREGHRHLGMAAAQHLEAMAEQLLQQHAPILWKDITADPTREEIKKKQWINKLLSLATHCCAVVSPNVIKGDYLDIRPYCKVKVIPGGSYRDCAYLSGVMFRKQVSHKKMAARGDVLDPRIMLLSGGIEFNRAENQIASLETLFEQEDKYMEILVGKILKLRPDVLLVGRSVSRRAQELLLKFDVVLVQHVKASLLKRISRQTGATVISSTDHVMTQFGASVLGKCRRFRLVAFRDNEIWIDGKAVDDGMETVGKPGMDTPNGTVQRSVKSILTDKNVSTVEREAALAAKQLGESVVDGAVAVKSGLAKRGVANTYIMLEGCPKHLGCTVVLRGSSSAALKQVKTVFRFLVNVAYNLRLETCFLRERGARLRPDFRVLPEHTSSSSLAVDFGKPPGGRKIRPWNGGNAGEEIQRPDSGEVTAFDHQSILITSVWMTEKSQCCPAEVKGICYYSLQDVALGQFLRDSCFNLSLKCQNPNCKKSVLDHSLSFVHNDGLISITVEEMESTIPSTEGDREDGVDSGSDEDEEEPLKPIATWTFCKKCKKVVTPLTFVSEETWKFSFGKFLEVFFYNRDAILNAPEENCSCNLQSASVLYFGCGKLAARFDYEPVLPYGVFVRKTLPIALGWHRAEAMRRLETISVASSELFVKFDKHINRVSREARSLLNSAVAVNRPENLQTILSELNQIGSEVDKATRTIQDRIASVTDSCRQSDAPAVNETLLRFPWLAKRYLFMLMTAWNEKLRAIGQVITIMKKLASVMGSNAAPSVVSEPLLEEISEGMKRLKELNERYARYNVTDITQSLPSLPNVNDCADGDFDDDFEESGRDSSMDFSEGVDADVLASRRRLQNAKQISQGSERTKGSRLKSSRSQHVTGDSQGEQESALSVPSKSTPGGAVKSAITRLFNRGGREDDAYVINLGIFGEGRPRLSPGVDGVVFPVIDDQLSTIIAYALVSPEYAKQFKHYSKPDGSGNDVDEASTSEKVRYGQQKNSQEKGDRGSKDSEQSKVHREIDDTVSTGGRAATPSAADNPAVRDVERRMLNRRKSHIKITFRDYDEKGRVTCKFVCTSYWATQFQAVREVFLSASRLKVDDAEDASEYIMDTEQSYIESLSSASSWAASGGKSGATFARTSDDRFVIKNISRTELQMFLECSSAYFEYLSKAFFHGLPTVLCKIVGVYQIAVHNRITGKESKSQVAVMQNIFYNKKISKIFDLKGSLRGRFAAHIQRSKDDSYSDAQIEKPTLMRKRTSDTLSDDASGRFSDHNSLVEGDTRASADAGRSTEAMPATLLDGDFLDFTKGRPMPLTDRAKSLFQMGILNDTLFLSIINVLDYSILVGVDAETSELVVGIIDFMRQYDILKQMERVGKSLPMVVGSEAPTIIQPPLYKARFSNAMERYFMTVPFKWTTI